MKNVFLTNVTGQTIYKKGHQLKAKEVTSILSLNLLGPVDFILKVGSIKCANVFGMDIFMKPSDNLPSGTFLNLICRFLVSNLLA